MNGNELRALYRTVNALTKRIERLEQQNRYTASSDWAKMNWWGRCSTSQPASKIINVRGGVFWEWNSAGGTGRFRWLSDTVYDFGGFPPFAAQYHYRWAILQANVSANPVTLRVYDSAIEWETPTEVEMDFWDNGPGDNLYTDYVPLCSIVLRSDGNLGPAGAVENVTLSDKEKSYMLVQDMRPFLHLHVTP